MTELYLLLVTAVSVAFFHTLMGPDHYLPFIVMAKARNWNTSRTLFTTALCGLGHVGSSIVIGTIGIALGIALHKITAIENVRGSLVAWVFLIFGFCYTVWGIWKALKNRPHSHSHFHSDGSLHEHTHGHQNEHIHVHEKKEKANITPWVLFVIFVLGPCEPLIPLLMYPAAKSSVKATILVASVFSIVTLGTMLSLVWLSIKGFEFVAFRRIEKYTHALAGGAIFICGIGMVFLGL